MQRIDNHSIQTRRWSAVMVLVVGIVTGYSVAANANEQLDAKEARKDFDNKAEVDRSTLALQTQPNDQIVVVASKVPRPLNTIAANVSVVSKQQIMDTFSTSVADVFQFTPGIDAESSGLRFGTESINIRGIGGNRVAMLIDGIPLGDQFDIGSFSNASRDFVNAGFIQRTEVLHGPASSLYGSDAIGGVVALYTPNPEDLMGEKSSGGQLLATWREGDHSAHVQATMAGGNQDLAVLGALSWRSGEQSQPFDPPSNPDQTDYERRSALVKLVANDFYGQRFKLRLLHQESDNQSDLRAMLGNGRFRSTSQLLGEDESEMQLWSLEYDIQALTPWLDSSLLRAYYQRSDIQQNTLDERALARTPVSIERLFSYQQRTSGLELGFHKSLENAGLIHRFAFGVELQRKSTRELRDGLSTELASSETNNTILGETFPLRDFPLTDSDENSAFIEYSLESGRWTTIAALRTDHFRLKAKVDDIYAEDFPDTQVVSLSESDLSPKLGVIYHLNNASELYLQYAHGFRAPPFEDANIGLDIPIFNVRAIPNPDLKSERSYGFDGGFRWRRAGHRFHFGLFHSDYRDFIETKVRLGLDPLSGRILFQSQNLDRARIRGIEAGWQIQLGDQFDFQGALYAADGINRQSGEKLASVGPEQLVMSLGWSSLNGRRNARLTSTLTNSLEQISGVDEDLFEPGSYALFDLFYSQMIGANSVLRLGVKNLTDQRHWIWSNVRGLNQDDPTLEVLTRPGRRASISFEYGW